MFRTTLILALMFVCTQWSFGQSDSDQYKAFYNRVERNNTFIKKYMDKTVSFHGNCVGLRGIIDNMKKIDAEKQPRDAAAKIAPLKINLVKIAKDKNRLCTKDIPQSNCKCTDAIEQFNAYMQKKGW